MDEYNVNKDFLGKGMKFPPQVNQATGRFVTVTEEQSVKESLYLILMTQKTERPLRPDFGSEIMSYTFLDVNGPMINMIMRTITDQIENQEPRVTDVSVSVDSVSRNGTVVFDIGYVIISSNTRDNLVFPFYLNAEEEEEEEEPEGYEDDTIEEIES